MDYEYSKEELLKTMNFNSTRKDQELDFIKCEGSYQQFVTREKRKAETKLIKLRILKKLHDSSALSQNEQIYLKKWQKGKLPKEARKVTKRSLGSLSEADKVLIEAGNSVSFRNCHEYPLNDFIMEFSLFFDEKFLQEVPCVFCEFRIKFLNSWNGV